MPATITLTRAAAANGTRLTVTATASTTLPVEVFRLYQDAGGDVTFEGVVAYAEVTTVPASPPAGGGRYRADRFNLTGTPDDLLATWDAVVAAVRSLVDAANAAARLTAVETVVIS